jgi:hypothetical protein
MVWTSAYVSFVSSPRAVVMANTSASYGVMWPVPTARAASRVLALGAFKAGVGRTYGVGQPRR